mmetsp:Transcript_16265/g.38177  ORF Transcript_16265/g.38177 Transcript_16265/m.38177 type:complete len:204 (+) Transcript_16265:377-988(+)
MACCGHNDFGLNDLGVHARLRVMVLCDQGPIRHHTADAYSLLFLPYEEVLHCHCIEELHVLTQQRCAHDRRHEERRMLDDDVVTFVIVGHLQLVEQRVRRLAHHHSTEQLASEPTAATWCHALLHDGHLHVWVFGELIGARHSSRTCTNDDHIRLRMLDHVPHVASSHFATDSGLPDRLKGHLIKGCELALHVGQSLGWQTRL